MRPIYAEPGLVLAIDDRKLWLYVNQKKWGFRHNGGWYCHRRAIETFRKEKGFYVPKVLLNYTLTFEVHVKEKIYATWQYTPKEKQRMLPTEPLIFLSCGRLVFTPEAAHVTRPK